MSESDDVIASLDILKNALMRNSQLSANSKKSSENRLRVTFQNPYNTNTTDKVPEKSPPKEQIKTKSPDSNKKVKGRKAKKEKTPIKSPQPQQKRTTPDIKKQDKAKHSPKKSVPKSSQSPKSVPVFREIGCQTSSALVLDDPEIVRLVMTIYGPKAEIPLTPTQKSSLLKKYFSKFVIQSCRKMMANGRAPSYDDSKKDSPQELSNGSHVIVPFSINDDEKQPSKPRVSFTDIRPDSANIVDLGDSLQMIDSVGSNLQESPIASKIGDNSGDIDMSLLDE